MKNTIPKATAKKWMNRWKKMEKDYNKHTPVNGFLIPLIDLQEVMSEPGVANVRTYLGIDDDNAEKLLIVGVDENGNDMLNEEEGQFVYDFTKACPPLCGELANEL